MAIVYAIKNTINERVYVGGTTNSLDRRLLEHISDARSSRHGIKLHKAMTLLGRENFYIVPLETCDDAKLLERENHWILTLNTIKSGYNTNLSSRPIVVFDLQSNLVGEYPSIREFSRQSDIDTHSISDCLTGKQRKSKGLVFLYKEDLTPELLTKRIAVAKNTHYNKKGREFAVHDIKGNLIGVFTSKTLCADQLGLVRSCITRCLTCKQRVHKGYTFLYVDEDT